jgi:hypothetical protein
VRTAAEAITDGLRFGLNKGSDTIQKDAEGRALAHHHLKAIVQMAHGADSAPLWYRHVDGTVSITSGTSGGVGTMPSTFDGAIGPQTEVYVYGTTLPPLQHIEPRILDELRQTQTALRTYPTLYTLKGKTALGLSKIEVWPFVSATVTLQLKSFPRRCPELYDAPVDPVVAEGSAGNLSGAYLGWRITFVHADGETEGGAISEALTVTNKRVNLTSVPLSPNRGCTARKVYRPVASGTVFKLVGTIADNVTTAYEDNVADGSLGAACPTPGEAVTGLEQIPDAFHELFVDVLIQRLKGSHGHPIGGDEKLASAIRQLWAHQKGGENAAMVMPAYAGSRQARGPVRRSWRERFPQ